MTCADQARNSRSEASPSRFAKITTLCAVAAALLVAEPAHAQFIDRLLFYNEDTGAHATASIEDPGELAIRMVYPDRIRAVAGRRQFVKWVSPSFPQLRLIL